MNLPLVSEVYLWRPLETRKLLTRPGLKATNDVCTSGSYWGTVGQECVLQCPLEHFLIDHCLTAFLRQRQ